MAVLGYPVLQALPGRPRSLAGDAAMVSALFGTASHHTDPWYIAVPILVIAFGLRAWLWRRRKPGWRRGPPGGSGNPSDRGGNDPFDGQN